jgi:hypothetical protein
LTKKFSHSDESILTYFDVHLDSEEDVSIYISLRNLVSKCLVYGKFNDAPTSSNYHFKIDSDGTFVLKSNDKFYHKEGRYFLLIQPHPDFI